VGLAAVFVFVVSAGFAGRAWSASYTAYVGSRDGTVTPIATGTNTPERPINIIGDAYGVAVSPDGSTAYITNGGTLTPIATATSALGSSLSVPDGAVAVAITPDGKTAYVGACCSYGLVTPITLATDTVGTAIPVGPYPFSVPTAIAITPDGSTAYVATGNGPESVTAIATSTNTPGPTLPIPGGAEDAIAISPNGETAYVIAGAGLVPISIATNTLEPVIVIPGFVGDSESSVAITPDGNSAYVTGANGVTPVSLTTNTAGSLIPMMSAGAIAITPDGKTAYVAPDQLAANPEPPGFVTPLTIATNTPGLPIPVGSLPDAIAITSTSTDRVTSTSIRCSLAGVVIAELTTCAATVTDIDSGPPATPTGLVTFTTTGRGTFSAHRCTLSGSDRVAVCQVTYTPSTVGLGQHTITATYSGDATHEASSASTIVKASTRSTSTRIACSPNPFAPGDATTCTATVSDIASGPPTTPTGTVNFSSDGTGSFEGSPCTLSESSPGVATCQVSFSSMVPGTERITARYSGDAAHTASTGSTSVTTAVPTSTKGCRIAGVGVITAADGDRAQFGIAGLTLPRSGRLVGLVSYHDFGPAQPLHLASWNLQALTCNRGISATGSIFGTGKLSRTTTAFFRLDVAAGRDSRSARNPASYRIRLSNGYDSGTRTPHPGRVAIVIHPR